MSLLLGGVAAQALALGLRRRLGHRCAQLGDRGRRVAVLPGVLGQLVAGQLAAANAGRRGAPTRSSGAGLLDLPPTSLLTEALLCRSPLLGRPEDNAPRRPCAERENIAAPDLPAGIEWIGEASQSMPVLTAAGPVLVHFVDFAQLNSVRHPPYLSECGPPLPEGRASHRSSCRRRASPSAVIARSSQRVSRASAYSCQSRSTATARSGTPMAARAGQASSSGRRALRLVPLRRGRIPRHRGGDPGRAARAGRAAGAARADRSSARHGRPAPG